MKTDWKAVIDELEPMLIPGLRKIVAELTVKHTHRTEEDLPQNGVWWTKHLDPDRRRDWFCALWKNGRVIEAWRPYDTPQIGNTTYVIVFHEEYVDVLNKDRLALKIGPKIEPPEK